MAAFFSPDAIGYGAGGMPTYGEYGVDTNLYKMAQTYGDSGTTGMTTPDPNRVNALVTAAGQNRGVINDWYAGAKRDLAGGYTTANRTLGQISRLYDPMLQRGRAAGDMYSNALGLNGQGGSQAATAAFQTGPGYQFAMDQGTQAALRAASASGRLSSGNTLTELTRYGQGLANQEYGGWMARLAGLGNTEMAATQGKAGALSSIADLAYGYGGDKAGLGSQYATGMMGVNNQIGSAKESDYARNWYGDQLEADRVARQKAADQQSRDNLTSNLIGLIGQGLGFFAGLSDRRAKTDIRRVGTTDGGLPVFTYRYGNDPTGEVRMGVMAQDVQEKAPDAVHMGRDGFLRVDYSRVN